MQQQGTFQTRQTCIGGKETVRSFLQGLKTYYIYILRRPDGRPFYVGKGTQSRVFQHETEARHQAKYSSNPYKINVIQKIKRTNEKILYEIDSLFDDEQEAYDRETVLIEGFGRLHEGGPLTNLAPGGGSTAGPAPFSTEKHQKSLGGIPENDPAKAIINGYLLSIGQPKSICVKVLGRSTKPKPTQEFTHTTRKPTLRQALALVASAAAEGIELTNGCKIPRHFKFNNVEAFIENGVSNDIATSKMAKVVPAQAPLDEVFLLNAKQVDCVVDLVGREKLISIGIL